MYIYNLNEKLQFICVTHSQMLDELMNQYSLLIWLLRTSHWVGEEILNSES